VNNIRQKTAKVVNNKVITSSLTPKYLRMMSAKSPSEVATKSGKIKNKAMKIVQKL
jgi:hypothetical protein